MKSNHWKNKDEAAYQRGMRFASGHSCGGNGYHRTREAAEKAAKKAARRACPDNPPMWNVHEIAAPAEDVNLATPWAYTEGSSPHYQGQVYREDTGETVAITYHDEDGANARLIAAAPNMLATLQALAPRAQEAKRFSKADMLLIWDAIEKATA
jgi:hypothetical protein